MNAVHRTVALVAISAVLACSSPPPPKPALPELRPASDESKAQALDRRFLREYDTREDAVVRPSGLRYRVLREGKGDQPFASEWVDVSVRFRLPDGDWLPRSEGEAEVLLVRPVEALAGLGEALALMREGASWELVMPSQLVGRTQANLPVDRVIVAEIELIRIRYDFLAAAVRGWVQDGRSAEAAEFAEDHLDGRHVGRWTLPLAIAWGEALAEIGETQRAIRVLARARHVIGRLPPDAGPKFSGALFHLARLHESVGDLDEALSVLDGAIAIDPWPGARLNAAHLRERLGDVERAKAEYRELADSQPLGTEVQVVARARLGALGEAQAFSPPSRWLRYERMFSGRSIRLVALNELDPRVELSHLCVVLATRFYLTCEVGEPLRVPDDELGVDVGGVYDAYRILGVLREHLEAPETVFLVAVTSANMRSSERKYPYSFHGPGSVAVVSTRWILEPLATYWDPQVLATRRVLIQTMTAVGVSHGLPPADDPACVMAIPSGEREFMAKGTRLCPATEREWKKLFTGVFRNQPFVRGQLAAIDWVYGHYLVE